MIVQEEKKQKNLEANLKKYKSGDYLYDISKDDSSQNNLNQISSQTLSSDSAGSSGIKVVPFKRNSISKK